MQSIPCCGPDARGWCLVVSSEKPVTDPTTLSDRHTDRQTGLRGGERQTDKQMGLRGQERQTDGVRGEERQMGVRGEERQTDRLGKGGGDTDRQTG